MRLVWDFADIREKECMIPLFDSLDWLHENLLLGWQVCKIVELTYSGTRLVPSFYFKLM